MKNETYIAIDTRTYTNTHGHAPRGRGHWAFELNRDIFFVRGTLLYSEALKLAIAQARIVECVRVIVLP